jgi:hypothetical protein
MMCVNVTKNVKDKYTIIPAPNQVGGHIKDTIYQTTGIAFFVRMRFLCINELFTDKF